MAKWKDSINKISEKTEKEREAAFEAAVLAEIAKGKPTEKPSPQPVPPTAASAPVNLSSADKITIMVTENGKATTYPDLASVPLPLRQKILNAWLAKQVG